MSTIELTTDANFGRARELLAQFGDLVKPAVMRGINRAAEGLPKYITHSLRGEYNLPASRIRRTFAVRRASVGDLLATVRSTSGAMPLYLFGARPSKPGRSTGAGVAVDVQGRKIVEGGTFVARMKSGHIGVFKRTGDSTRMPIHELFGPSVPTMVEAMDERSGGGFSGEIADEADRRFGARIGHEVDQLLKRMGAR